MPHAITCKTCRRLGQSVCGKANCALRRKPYPPGVHGKRRSRLSEFGQQLIEKQKLKLIYGLRERQFRNYFEHASTKTEQTGPALIGLLESRLDNVVYRLGFAVTRSQARQLVSHGHFTVNGRKVTIPSYNVKPGDVIAIRSGSIEAGVFADLRTRLKKYEPPVWLMLDVENLTGTVQGMPDKDTVGEIPVHVGKIVEFYSR